MASKAERAKAGAEHLRIAIRCLKSALRKAERGDFAQARYSNSNAIEQIQKADEALHETMREFLARNHRDLIEMGLIPKEARDGR